MSQCSQCGATFGCAMADADAAEPCWCTALPNLPATALTQGACLCPRCLAERLRSATPPDNK
ncbi:hypothetical protein RCH09_000100 [Actimicrobium sp. GrIS 1.19]|uniref:cysteine-rich CWC family protein n=1 Tax=Actimicrobium sp. GrIS 1.19 TaxID=3071708 RepID=UPI002E032B77|nr:hypothetical protein [Actimicrobium sp. GrIS 1.19]